MQQEFMELASKYGKCTTLSGANRVFVEIVPNISTLVIFTPETIHVHVTDVFHNKELVKAKLPVELATVPIIMALARLPMPYKHVIYQWMGGWYPVLAFDTPEAAREKFFDLYESGIIYKFEDEDNGYWVNDDLEVCTSYSPKCNQAFTKLSDARAFVERIMNV